MLRIELPFPPAELFPNRKNGKHWASVAGAKTKAWGDAYTLAHQAVNKHRGEWYPLTGDIPVSITFCPPDKRLRDDDNCLAACKAQIDGVATALTVNDRQFTPITLKRGEPIKGGAVVLEIGA
jgi:crossover junction endodeoxyribonuclease RusA